MVTTTAATLKYIEYCKNTILNNDVNECQKEVNFLQNEGIDFFYNGEVETLEN